VRVRLFSAQDLIAADSNGSSDPYVKLSLGSRKDTSTVKEESLDPVWDQVFEFPGEPRLNCLFLFLYIFPIIQLAPQKLSAEPRYSSV